MLKNLSDIRTKRAMTLRDLEALSGISKSAIRDYEKGKHMPKIDTTYRLAKALRVHPEKLFLVLLKGENFFIKGGVTND